MSESIKRWVPIPAGVEVDVGTYGTDKLDTEEIAYLLRMGGIDARSVDQAVSSAQERAAEVIARVSRIDHVDDGIENTSEIAAALAAAGLLVDDDTARLVALGRAVEALERRDERLSVIGHGMWNACLDAIYREAGVGTPSEAQDRPLSGPRIDAAGRNAPNPPDSSDGHTEAVSGGAG